MTTAILLALATVDVTYELVAHFVFGNRTLKTLSFVVRAWEGRNPWRLAAVSGVLFALWLHLVAKFF